MATDTGRTDDEGLGKDGSIPDTDEGVAVGHTSESSFEPEEDEQAPE
ncbi:hypothetical protein HQ346_10350 [Rhodococcus sp. BP-252]|nr:MULTISPECIES: hypothetical protein [Rhodococcus]MBY6412313.1 hypothetical protein [Rhodococcus sp. BP-320]MBY6416893.1 hypothetical protein [Rhodococcus sp. BP-321]MBY6421569.1 hypothetical protein [Rhodococcus sp. BP-324]MBY6426835.1 hypothetical protein [Rhodococcus sp. BP-323]MBY6432001.1 hypothetical protein [Rhodococcus sp. BP-322]